jgi:alpha-N-arabinofuranosidase
VRKINPIIKGFSPDPSICKSDGFYYLVTSSFEYFPGIAIYKSQNLEDWELINYAIKESKGNFNYETIDDSLGIFAPTIRKYKDKFYIFCTFVDPREDVVDQNFYVYTTDPEQEWSNPVLLDFEGIDPSPFFTERGCYVQFSAKDETGRSCIKQALISLDGKHNILKEEIISYGSGGRDVEAPHIFLKDDYYYLLTAEGGTREGHMVTISRSRDIWGPYDSYIENPILTHRDDAKHPVQNVGHADIIKDYKGNYHMVCLGTRPVNFKHNLGREVFKTTFIWEKNQWPKINKTLSIKPLKSQKITENWEKNYSSLVVKSSATFLT